MSKMVTKGFTDIYGYEWDQVQCKAYNIATAFVDKLEALHPRVKTDSLADKEINQAKEYRHRIYHLPLYSATRGIVNNSNISV